MRCTTTSPTENVVEFDASSRRLIWRNVDGLAEADPQAPGGVPWEAAVPLRETARYPGRRNVDGLYWCAQLDKHVYFESLLEKQVLMWMDHSWDLSVVVSQPFELRLEADFRHIPDFLVQTSDGRMTVVNVKPSGDLREKVLVLFERVQQWARSVGWSAEVFSELPDAVGRNLRWVAGYRAKRHAPAPEDRARILRLVSDRTLPLNELWHATLPSTPATVAAVYHLLWERDLHLVDPQQLLGLTSEVTINVQP